MLITDITLPYIYCYFHYRMSTSLIDEIDEISKQADLSDLGHSQPNMHSNTVHLEPIVPKKKKRRKKKQNQDNIEMNSMASINMTNSMASHAGGLTTLDGIENPSFESNTLERNQPERINHPELILTNPTIDDENNNTRVLDHSQISKEEQLLPENPEPPQPTNGLFEILFHRK